MSAPGSIAALKPSPKPAKPAAPDGAKPAEPLEERRDGVCRPAAADAGDERGAAPPVRVQPAAPRRLPRVQPLVKTSQAGSGKRSDQGRAGRAARQQGRLPAAAALECRRPPQPSQARLTAAKTAAAKAAPRRRQKASAT